MLIPINEYEICILRATTINSTLKLLIIEMGWVIVIKFKLGYGSKDHWTHVVCKCMLLAEWESKSIALRYCFPNVCEYWINSINWRAQGQTTNRTLNIHGQIYFSTRALWHELIRIILELFVRILIYFKTIRVLYDRIRFFITKYLIDSVNDIGHLPSSTTDHGIRCMFHGSGCVCILQSSVWSLCYVGQPTANVFSAATTDQTYLRKLCTNIVFVPYEYTL